MATSKRIGQRASECLESGDHHPACLIKAVPAISLACEMTPLICPVLVTSGGRLPNHPWAQLSARATWNGCKERPPTWCVLQHQHLRPAVLPVHAWDLHPVHILEVLTEHVGVLALQAVVDLLWADTEKQRRQAASVSVSIFSAQCPPKLSAAKTPTTS